jgi:hypothetical protein
MADHDIEVISDQLQILQDYQVLSGIERQQILDKLKKEPNLAKDYSDSLSKGLPGLTKGVIGVVKARQSGDPLAISIASFEICAGVLTIAGPLLGPAGPVFSALATMISTILGEFVPKPPSLKQELTLLLNKFLAEEKLRSLGTALDEIWVLSDTIQHHSTDYKPLNLQHGTEVKAIDDAWQWLKQEDKQSVAEWGQVLEKTCMVWLQLVRCVALSVAKPSTKAGVDKNAMLVYLPARQEIFLDYLRSIKPVAQNAGLFLESQAWDLNGNVLYVALGKAGGLGWDYKRNTGWIRGFSVHFPYSERGSSTPKYEVVACTEFESCIDRHTVDSVHGDLANGRRILSPNQDVENIGGGSRQFFKCVDAWALPDSEDHTGSRIYTAHDAGYCYVNVHVVDANDKVRRVNWEPHTGAGLTRIRAVRRDVTDSLPGDSDVAGMQSRQYEVIYGGYQESPGIWVAIDNSWSDVPSPWPRYNGIEVDDHFLWVFGTEGMACATHASVLQCKNGAIPSPRWITYKTSWTDGFNVMSLSACIDGTLAVGSDQPVQRGLVMWSGTYEVNLEQRSLTWNYKGEPRGGAPKQLKKMPISCWPVFSHVLNDLETKVGQGHGHS